MSLIMNPETIHLIAGWVLREDQVFRILDRHKLPYKTWHPLSTFERLLDNPDWAELGVRAVYCSLQLSCDREPDDQAIDCMVVVHEVLHHRLPVTVPQATIGIPAEALAFDNLDGKTRLRAIAARKKLLGDLLGAETSESAPSARSWIDIPWKVTQDPAQMYSWDSHYGADHDRMHTCYEVDPAVSNAELNDWEARTSSGSREGTPSSYDDDED